MGSPHRAVPATHSLIAPKSCVCPHKPIRAYRAETMCKVADHAAVIQGWEDSKHATSAIAFQGVQVAQRARLQACTLAPVIGLAVPVRP